MSCKMSLEEICSMVESSVFDRKSAKIDAKSLAVHLIAFANADGGTLAIGVEDDGEITGIDGYAENINELLRAPFDFCKPSVQVETERIPCKNAKGLPDHILLIEVLQSNDIHANQADEVFFRIGDKSKKLNFDERWTILTWILCENIRQNSDIGKVRRNICWRIKSLSRKRMAGKRLARLLFCSLEKIRSTFSHVHVFALFAMKEQKPESARQ